MKQCTVSSSDLAMLRSLSRQLGRPTNEAAATPDDSAVNGLRYTRFAPARREVGDRSRSEPHPSVQPPPPLLEPSELGTWDAMLAWGMELCRSRAGFVVDSQGFVIASRGNVPEDGFEGTGAELCYAMEQLDRLEGGNGAVLKAVELQYEGQTLASIRVSGEADDTGYILCFVGSRALIPEVRDTIIRQASLGIGNLL